MRSMLSMLPGLLLALGLYGQTGGDNIIGKWTNQDQTRIIEVVKNGNVYEAIVLKAEDKALVGKKQITGLTAMGNGNFTNGVVHLIKKGKTARCTAVLLRNNQLQLKATYGMMSKTQTWTRL